MPTDHPPTLPGWADDHDDDDHDEATGVEDGLYWEPPRGAAPAPFVPRIGVTGRRGSDLHSLVASLTHRCTLTGYAPLVVFVASETFAALAAVRRTLADVLDPARVVGVTLNPAARDAPALLAAVATEFLARHPDTDALLLAAHGNGPASALDAALVHFTVALVDGTLPGADLFVVNIASPEPQTEMGTPAGIPIVPVNLDTGAGVDDLFALLRDAVFDDPD